MARQPSVEAPDALNVDERRALRRKTPRTGDSAIDALQAEIEAAREATRHTINELERRLSYDRIKAKVKDRARAATVGRMRDMARNTGDTSRRWGRGLFETVKGNPLPALMVGGGMAWLFASRSSRGKEHGESGHPRYVERRQVDEVDKSGTYGIGFIDRRRTVGERPEPSADAATRGAKLKEDLRRKAEEAKHQAAETRERLKEKASHVGEQARHKARQVGGDTADYAGEAGRRIARGGRNAGQGLVDFIETNPLAAAGIVLTAGVVVGATMPSSRYEDERLGPARDRLVDRARETGREQAAKVGSVVDEAKEAAKAEAEAQGLVDREKADRAEQKAREMAGAGREKVKTGFKSMEDESGCEPG